MNATALLEMYERVADAPDAVGKLRRMVLELAIRGKLESQDVSDEPVGDLLVRIRALKKSKILTRAGTSAKAATAHYVAPFAIPDSWRWSQLAEVGDLSPRNEAADDGDASFVPMTLLSADYGVPNQHTVRPWKEIKKGYTHFAEGDVALAKITPCFENRKSTVFRNLTGGFGSGTTELHVLRPILIDPGYVLIFLKSPYFIDGGIPRMTGTAGQKRIPAEYFAKAPFPLPPLAEQHRIVAKVDELMALCDQLEASRTEREAARNRLAAASLARLNVPDPDTFQSDARFALNVLAALSTRPDQIKQLRQTILNLAVRGKLVPQDPSDEPAAVLLGRVTYEIATQAGQVRSKAAPLIPVSPSDMSFNTPLRWKWARLSELFGVIADGDHQPPPQADSGVAFLTIGNVTTGRIDFANCRLVPRSYYDKLSASRTPQLGDILYTVVGATYGRAIFVETDREFCVQRHIAIMRPSRMMNSPFLVMLLRSPFVYRQASAATTGTAQPTIGLGPLRRIAVCVPPLAEQCRIVEKVEELMSLCDHLEASLTTAESTRSRMLDALLHEALKPSLPI